MSWPPSENELFLKQLTRIADALEEMNERAKLDAPLAREVLEISLRAQRKLAEEADI